MADEIRSEQHTEQNRDHHYERRMAWGWWVFAVIALFYLLTEHRAHLFGVLPYLFLLACPLMHFFMHGQHGGHGGHGRTDGNEEDKK